MVSDQLFCNTITTATRSLLHHFPLGEPCKRPATRRRFPDNSNDFRVDWGLGALCARTKFSFRPAIMELRRNDIVPKKPPTPRRLPRTPPGAENPYSDLPSPRRVRRKPREGSSLLVDRPGYSRPTACRRLGRKDNRPALKYMRAFAEAWPEKSIVQQLIAQLPWGHNLRVLDRIKDRPTREWYLRAALEYGWR
jgi:hypothetical protein